MVNHYFVKQILKMRFIDDLSYTKIEAYFKERYKTSDYRKFKVSRQTIAKICNNYSDLKDKYRKAYYRKEVDKFLERHPYKRDGTKNRVLDDDDIADIKNIVKNDYITPYKRRYVRDKTKIGEVIYDLRRYHGYSYVTYSTLYRKLKALFPDYFSSEYSKSKSKKP
jgi:hypothetical protein